MSEETAPSSPAPTVRFPKADLTITATDIRLRGREQAIATFDQPRDLGLGLQYKRSTPNDLFIVPLGDTVRPGQDAYIIDVEPSTPFRILIEVVFTLAQRGIARWTLRSSKEPARAFELHAPAAQAGADAGPTPPIAAPSWFVVFVIRDGFSIQGPAGNFAPGCDGVAAGITIPKRGAEHDFQALEGCLRKIKASAPDQHELLMAANPGTDFETLLRVVEAARVRDGAGFTEFGFRVPR